MSLSAYIDLSRLSNNLELLKNGAKDKMICAVVKANAYGHGAVKVCKRIENGVDYFAVASEEEGSVLRLNGITKPILVLCPSDENISLCVKRDLTIGVGSTYQAREVRNVFDKLGGSCPIHIQIDSGMNRFGFSNVLDVKKALSIFDGLCVNGVYSHVYSSDSYFNQIDRFKSFEYYVKERFCGVISHISSSFYADKPYGDMIRTGLSLYGYPKDKFQPVMSISSEVLAVKKVCSGQICGYDGIFVCDGIEHKIAIIKGGYADGISRNMRKLSGVLHNGRILPIIAVCMDSVCVLADNTNLTRGDKVVFVGESNSVKYYFDDIAKQIGAIPYELMTNISSRVRREYID